MHGVKRKCIVAAFLCRDGVSEDSAKVLSDLCTSLNPAFFDILQPQWVIAVFLDNTQNRSAVADIIKRHESKTLGLSENTGLGIRIGDVLLGIEGKLVASKTRPIGYPMSEAMQRAHETTLKHPCEGCEDLLNQSPGSEGDVG